MPPRTDTSPFKPFTANLPNHTPPNSPPRPSTAPASQQGFRPSTIVTSQSTFPAGPPPPRKPFASTALASSPIPPQTPLPSSITSTQSISQPPTSLQLGSQSLSAAASQSDDNENEDEDENDENEENDSDSDSEPVMPESPASPKGLTAASGIEDMKTRGTNDVYPTTALITSLLRRAGGNGARRDKNTFAHILSRVKATHDEIVEMVNKLKSQKPKDGQASDWKLLFESYTTGILELEKVLFKLPRSYYIRTQESTHSLTLPPDTGTDVALKYICMWSDERGQELKALESMKQHKLQKKFSSSERMKILNSEYAPYRWKDDKSVMESVLKFLKTSKLTDREIIQGNASASLVTDVTTLTQTIVTSVEKHPNDIEKSGIASRALMTVYIPFAIVSAAATSSQWRTYLKTEPVWVSIKLLLGKVESHLNTPNKEIEKEFSIVEKILRERVDVTIDTSAQIHTLRTEIAPNTSRAYLFRTVALLKTLEYLDEYSLQEKNKELNGYRHGLKLAMEDATAELRDISKGSDNADFETFSTKSREYASGSSRCLEAFVKIKPLFENFQVTNEWPTYERIYNEQAKTDETHMSLGAELLGL